MPVDFRYHVISLVAVFCALAIGLLIGFSMVSSPQLEEHVKTLNQKVNERIEELNSKVQAQDQFIASVRPWVLDDRLAGRQIAIIVARSTGDSKKAAEAVEGLAHAITAAGGQVSSRVQIGPRLYWLGDPKYERTRTRVNEVLALDTSDLEALPRLAASAIAESLILGTDRAKKLEKAPIVKFSGSYYAGADSVVLVGGLADEDDAPLEMLDLPVIAKCQQFRPPVRVVACEMSDAPVSAIARYKQANVDATVDNADTLSGRVAVVFALQGKSGNFGIKDTAESLLPAAETTTPTAQR